MIGDNDFDVSASSTITLKQLSAKKKFKNHDSDLNCIAVAKKIAHFRKID